MGLGNLHGRSCAQDEDRHGCSVGWPAGCSRPCTSTRKQQQQLSHWALAGWHCPGSPAAAQGLPLVTGAGSSSAARWALLCSTEKNNINHSGSRIPTLAGERGCSLAAASGGENLETKAEKISNPTRFILTHNEKHATDSKQKNFSPCQQFLIRNLE